MSKSISSVKLILLSVFVGLVVASAHPLAAFDPQESSTTVLHEFLHSVYPELFGKGWYLDVSAFQPIDGMWRQVYETRFKVTDGPPVPGNPTIDLATRKRFTPEAQITMEGFFQVTPNGQIERMYVWNSKLVQSEQNEKLHELVQSHPEWSESDAYKTLKDAGARFGPSDQEQFIKSIRLDKFDKFLGHLQVVSANFDGFANPDHAGDFALLYWSVEVHAKLPDGTHAKYTLSFEPFDGRLTGLKHLP